MPKRSVTCLLAAVGACAGLATPALAKTGVPPWRQSPPLNIAHQGGEDEFPSNTLFAFKEATKAGARMLELDIGVTKDNKVIVMHDTTVDSKTNATGLVSSLNLAQIRRLDGAYWFSRSAGHYSHDKAPSAYPFRGVATGNRKPPKGYKASDFRVPTLQEVMKAFPRTPINIEIKGRTTAEKESEYLYNAGVLARLLKSSKRRDLIVVSFRQGAVDRFHALAPRISTSPGSDGIIDFLLRGKRPGAANVAVQVPMTYELGGKRIEVANAGFIKKVHDAGLAWHSWFDGPDVDGPAGWGTLVQRCVDGIMTSRPRALQRFLKKNPTPSTCAVK